MRCPPKPVFIPRSVGRAESVRREWRSIHPTKSPARRYWLACYVFEVSVDQTIVVGGRSTREDIVATAAEDRIVTAGSAECVVAVVCG